MGSMIMGGNAHLRTVLTQIIEDIDNYGRLHQMFHLMKPSEKRKNDGIEGFGNWDDTVTDTIDNGKTRTVGFTPMLGLFSQGKYLPIRYAPIQIELELVSSGTDALIATGGAAGDKFQITDVQLKADLVTLDNSLDNEYSQHLLSGKTLPIHFSTFTCASQVITSLNTTVNVSRALTRLKGVFVTMSTDSGGALEVDNFYHPMGGGYDHDKELEFEMQI